MFYFTKTPGLLRALYKSCIWRLHPARPTLYLTFDDGPHPEITPFVLEQLRKYEAQATFFCLGKNVAACPDLYQELFINGHAVGNHTQDHLNGWKTNTKRYVDNILLARQYIDSNLFRPPYGRITPFQVRELQSRISDIKIVMWDVLSGDFDTDLSPQGCLQKVLFKSESGSIVVFHDSAKAWERMSYALPRVLDYYSRKGFRIAAIPQN